VKHITDTVERYRQALLYLWNSCVWPDPSCRHWGSVYEFRGLRPCLFKFLVAGPLGLESDAYFGREFLALPNDLYGFHSIMVNLRESSDSTGVWDSVKGPFGKDDITLTIVDHFDFSPLGYIDLRYYRVLIEFFKSHPEWVGHHALVEVIGTDVFLKGEAAPAGDRETRRRDEETRDIHVSQEGK
jgi:hypothetical protein